MNEPIVSILTPVYNGEKYLVECIESVLAQTYQNWEYVIVNNCSTDRTLEIAQNYAEKDKRITVVNNHHFVGVIENHNRAFQLISEQSKYCKVVSADDWIYPECLSKMIKLAEDYPSVSIVGSYQLSGSKVRWKGLPLNTEIIAGREICRLNLLKYLDVSGDLEYFDVSGDPTSSLYRSDLIRKNTHFFPHLLPYADTSAFFKYLQYSDYGFVHEILSIERIHDAQESVKVKALDIPCLAVLDILLQYGPIYLSENEFLMLKNVALKNYWRWLGACLLQLKGVEFWRLQTSRLKELGYPLPWRKVIKGAIDEVIEEMHTPKAAINKFIAVLKDKYQIRRAI